MTGNRKVVFLVGFSLFAMFFGAGNLIFPTYLGYTAGSYWLPAFLVYIISDGVLAMVALYSVLHRGGMDNFLKPLGKYFGNAILICICLCIGPIVAIPRTATITHELGVVNFHLPITNQVITSLIFFLITYFICIKADKIVDIIGKYLTPSLLAFLVLLILAGIINPVGDIPKGENFAAIMNISFISGFQTLDGLGGALFSVVIVNALAFYKIPKENHNKTIISSLGVALLCLTIVYGGLCYLGATSFDNVKNVENGTVVLNSFTSILFGRSGVLVLSLIVILACLTTSVALVSSTSEFFAKLLPKVGYHGFVIVVILVSFVLSTLGIDNIIAIAVPILFTLYPPVIVLIFSSFFANKYNCDRAIKAAAVLALCFGLANVLMENAYIVDLIKTAINKLPFSDYGFAYLIPCIVVFVLFVLFDNIKDKNTKENSNTDEMV